MGTLATLTVRLVADASKFSQGLDAARSSTRSFIGGVQSLGKVALGVGGVALGAVGAGVGALGTVMSGTLPKAEEFQSSLTDLTIAARGSGLSFQELHDASLAVGGDTRLLGVSASGAADSLVGLYKAGLSTGEIFGDLQGYMAGTAELGGALRAAIDTAAATELDMVQASDLAAVVLATFGAELETEAERAGFVNTALNNMVQAADASVAEVGDLAMALKNVGPTAASMGIGIEDVNNALAILSTRGIQGAEAGTVLKSMLANMRRPTDKVVGALAELGVKLYDAEGAFVGLPSVIEQMQKGMAGLTDEQRDQYVQTIAGTYGMNALNTLLAEGVAGWEAMAGATAEAAGIEEQAAAKASTLAGVKEALAGTIETLAIGIGEKFIPLATGLAGTLSTIAERVGPLVMDLFGRLAPFLDMAASGFDSFVAALLAGQDPLTALQGMLADIGLDQVATGLGTVAGKAQELWATVQPYVEQIAGWVAQHVELKDVLIALGIAIASVVIPAIVSIVASVAPVVAAFVGLVALVALMREAWETDFLGIRTALTEAWAVIQPALQQLVAWLQVNVPLALQALADLWNNVLLPAITAVWEFVEANLLPLLLAIADVVDAVLGVALTALAGIFQNVILPVLKKVAEKVMTKLKPALESLSERVGPLKEAFVGIGKAIQDAIGWLHDLAEKIRDIKLPDWMTPGSPTPLELGLRGIAEATRSLARVHLPALRLGFAAAAPGLGLAGAAAVPAGVGTSVGSVTFNIYGARDADAAAEAVIRKLEDVGILPVTRYR